MRKDDVRYLLTITIVLAGGNAYANSIYHFAESPNNNGAIEIEIQDNVNEFLLSDLTKNKNGQSVDAINSGKMGLTVAPIAGNSSATGIIIKSGTFTNQPEGKIDIFATTKAGLSVANGLQASDAYWSSIRNQGLINAHSRSLQGSSDAYGINAGLSFSDAPGDRYGDHMALINDGKISVISSSLHNALARGIYSNSANGLTNNGELTVRAMSQAGVAKASGLHTVHGNPVVAPDHGNPTNPTHVMENNGRLTVIAQGDTAIASGIYTEGDDVIINNSGTLSVHAQSQNGESASYGIHIVDGSATVQSNGLIHIAATSDNNNHKSYAIMADGSNVNVGSYTLSLGNKTPWAVSNNGEITLGDGNKGADLLISPGYKEDGFEYGKTYQLDSLAYDTTNSQIAKVKGKVGTIHALTQDFNVIHAVSENNTPGSVTLVYAPRVSHAGISAIVQRSTMTQVSDIISSRQAEQLIRGGCDNASDTNNCVFITPYAGDYRRDKNPSGYSGYRYGVLLGQDYQFGKIQLGWHSGYEKANTGFNGASKGHSEDINTFMLGIQGGFILEDNHFATATTTFFRNKTNHNADNIYNGIGKQSASYMSSGAYTYISMGKFYDINRDYKITPMAGLVHIWQHRDRYTISSDNSDYDLLDTHYEKYSGQAIASDVKVRIDGNYPLTSSLLLKPYFSIGIQQTLYGDEIKIRQSVVNAQSVEVSTKDSSTLASFNFGITLLNKNGFMSDLLISGNKSSDRTDYTGRLNMEYTF
ncbi:autotransporter outer membrane beta-barrel domain-containing protein [Salmonella enterica]|nr:autotransporter outer membrane beta-barrel domain-containing protein [Salmonella enterica]EAX6581930.1 autotransporter outer membrane beta-barrel domain-containing protein [Salmonella enterica]